MDAPAGTKQRNPDLCLDEEELLELSRQGDQDAFAVLVHLYYRRVVSIGYRLTGDVALAEDIAQETFLKVWSNLRGFVPQSSRSFQAWVLRIAHNTAVDFYRRHRPTADLDGKLEDGGPTPEVQALRNERDRAVQEAISRLPERSREVLVLREYGGLSYAEMAETLEIPIGTVMSRLNYARNALRKELAPYMGSVDL